MCFVIFFNLGNIKRYNTIDLPYRARWQQPSKWEFGTEWDSNENTPKKTKKEHNNDNSNKNNENRNNSNTNNTQNENSNHNTHSKKNTNMDGFKKETVSL